MLFKINGQSLQIKFTPKKKEDNSPALLFYVPRYLGAILLRDSPWKQITDELTSEITLKKSISGFVTKICLIKIPQNIGKLTLQFIERKGTEFKLHHIEY